MKVAVVGSNRGIGLALTQELVAKGYEVFAFCREASSELEQAKPKKIVEKFEVTHLESMESLLKDSGISDIDHLYHVSGIMRPSSLESLDVKGIKEQFEINSIGPLLCTQAFLPILNEKAKIGLLTSRMGSIGDNSSGGAYGYRMSKSALNCVGKSLSLDLKESGKSVFLLHPGWVKTDMTGNSGMVDTKESALGLIKIMETKSHGDTGTFWHMNGEQLPW